MTMLASSLRGLYAFQLRSPLSPCQVRLSSTFFVGDDQAKQQTGQAPEGYISDEEYNDNSLQDVSGELSRIKKQMHNDVRFLMKACPVDSSSEEAVEQDLDALIDQSMQRQSVLGNWVLQWERWGREGFVPPSFTEEHRDPVDPVRGVLLDPAKAKLFTSEHYRDGTEYELAKQAFRESQPEGLLQTQKELYDQLLEGKPANDGSLDFDADDEGALLGDAAAPVIESDDEGDLCERVELDSDDESVTTEDLRQFNKAFAESRRQHRIDDQEFGPVLFEHTEESLPEERMALSPKLGFDLTKSALLSAPEREQFAAESAEKLRVFLEALGRKQSQYLKKFESFEDLLYCTGEDLKKRGVPVTDRRYIFRWREKYLRGWFFPGDKTRSPYYPQEKTVRKPKVMTHRKKKMFKQSMVK